MCICITKSASQILSGGGANALSHHGSSALQALAVCFLLHAEDDAKARAKRRRELAALAKTDPEGARRQKEALDRTPRVFDGATSVRRYGG